MTDEREYWRSAIVGRIDEQQPIYAGELLDEIVALRAQLAEIRRQRDDYYQKMFSENGLVQEVADMAEKGMEAEAARDELQRKLDACQCETRVLNESMLIEAERERDQLVAECGLLREALETLKDHVPESLFDADRGLKDETCLYWNGGEFFIMVGALRRIVGTLASTPHAAKAVERMRKLEAVAKAARHFYGHYGPLNDALDRLDALDKPEVQDEGKGGQA